MWPNHSRSKILKTLLCWWCPWTPETGQEKKLLKAFQTDLLVLAQLCFNFFSLGVLFHLLRVCPSSTCKEIVH